MVQKLELGHAAHGSEKDGDRGGRGFKTGDSPKVSPLLLSSQRREGSLPAREVMSEKRVEIASAVCMTGGWQEYT